MIINRVVLAFSVIYTLAPGPALVAQVAEDTTGNPEAAVYIVGPEDTLSITVADEPELTGRFRVDSHGTFSYPYVGRVEADGRSLSELQAVLTRS